MHGVSDTLHAVVYVVAAISLSCGPALDYATGDMGEHSYGFLPLMAVRFPAQADGSCILVVEPDRLAFDDSYVARVLDCEQNKLRDLAVESVDVVPDGGENRW